ncbi:hypothetical protein CPB84DRAFT_1754274 [Gymnopilus junonius]|uniref:Uncharacterized protein n=1 Tax=Gymnopilus junonius TaxID=109634 RepID=A0A9P5TEP2_GYMJU|nr:hypothetical protein CPB84DRAFT_1754274 [Gymnopilus junonius]
MVEWPVTYDDEMFHARGWSGTFSMQTKVTINWMSQYLREYIRDALESNGLDWGMGLVFLHQIHGIKNATTYSHTDAAAEESLVKFLKKNLLISPEADSYDELLQSRKWWIDVGVEVASDQEQCLAWRMDSHFDIVQQCITSVSSSQYTHNMLIHLPSISGCRITPGQHAQGEFKVNYMQMYTTDKALIYCKDQGHHGKFITCEDVLKGKGGNYTQHLFDLYWNAAVGTYCLAHLEVHIPLAHTSRILLSVDHGLLIDSLISLKPSAWWAIKMVFEWQQEGPADLRSTNEVLLLTMVCVWILNGLHSTPDMGPSSYCTGADPDILAYGCPTEESDDEDSSSDELTDSDDEQPPHKRHRTSNTAAAVPYDPGSDLENNKNVGNMPDEPISVNVLLTHLWCQFLLDLTVKAPNQKGVHKPSYCILTAEQCLSITEATYQNMMLLDYFLDFHNTIKKKYDKFYWVPFAQTDRIWGTKWMPTFKKSSNVDTRKAASQIFLNPCAKELIWLL